MKVNDQNFFQQTNALLDNLLAIATNDEQKNQLLGWFSSNFTQVNVDMSFDLTTLQRHGIEEIKDWQLKSAVTKLAQNYILDKGIVVEKIIPNTNDQWEHWEERYRVSLLIWKPSK